MNLPALYRFVLTRLVLIIFLYCLPAQVEAQPYQFENLTEANGLSDNRVTCFLKDRAGFMWIGTENGLNRFDGRSFAVYNQGIKKRKLSNSFVNDIEQDQSGRLWIATQSGLNVINPDNDSNFIFMPDVDAYRQKQKTIPSDLIWDIYIDNKERVWLAADSRDLCYYNNQTGVFTYFPWKKFLLAHFPQRAGHYNSIRRIYYKSDDELWLGTSIGLFSFRISTGEFTYHKSHQADHFIQLETSPDKNTVYFIQNPVNSLQVLSLPGGTKKDLPWSAISTIENADIPDPLQKRWLPAGRDIIEVNASGKPPFLIRHRTDDPYSLPDGIVSAIYRDNTGLVWVGTSNGIGRFNPGMNYFPFTEVLPAPDKRAIHENDMYRYDQQVHTVLYSRAAGKYFISSPAGNCLIIKDRISGQSTILQQINGIALRHCSVIFEDSHENVWVLAARNAFCYNPRTQQFITSGFHTDESNLLFTDMAEDEKGNFWIASMSDGLYYFNNSTSSIHKKKDGFYPVLPTSLYFDKEEKKLWIGTFDYGLFCYDAIADKVVDFPTERTKPGYIHSSLIRDITKDKEGRIWIATHAAGIVTHASGDTSLNGFSLVATGNDIPENNFYSLQCDRDGNIWAGTYKGLTKITAGGRIENFNRTNGLGFNDFNSPITIAATGEMFTGVSNGFIRFKPDSTHFSSPDFRVILTTFRAGDSILSSGALADQRFEFPYTDNEVEFSYAALSFFYPLQTRYEYKLDNVDKSWVQAGNKDQTSYNNLSAGKYTFRVRAVDFTGQQSFNVASLSFSIRPPWWKTWWFRLLTFVVVAGIAGYLLRRRIQTIQTKAAIKQQMAELKGQALRAQMNPHFIFNCLNAIQELIVTENYTASYQYLSKFSKLLRLVLHLSEKNLITLNHEIEMCRLYLELESLRFNNSFEYTVRANGIDTDTVLFPTLLLQPLVENALWHGLRQKEGDKKLSVVFQEKNGNLVCTIQDNGIGRKKAEAIKTQKIGSQHFDSKGLELVRQRIETLKAAGLQDAAIHITDCQDEDGNATGTKVEIIITSTLKQ